MSKQVKKKRFLPFDQQRQLEQEQKIKSRFHYASSSKQFQRDTKASENSFYNKFFRGELDSLNDPLESKATDRELQERSDQSEEEGEAMGRIAELEGFSVERPVRIAAEQDEEILSDEIELDEPLEKILRQVKQSALDTSTKLPQGRSNPPHQGDHNKHGKVDTQKAEQQKQKPLRQQSLEAPPRPTPSQAPHSSDHNSSDSGPRQRKQTTATAASHLTPKLRAFEKAKLEFQAKQRGQQAQQQARQDKHETIRKSILKRRNQSRKLLQRTEKGQPVIKNQLFRALDKIQKQRQ